MNIVDRKNSYNSNQCWQYDIRLKNLETDLEEFNLNKSETDNLKVSDFELKFEEKSKIYNEVKKFIEKHEWLGKMSLYPTHIFTARYKGILAGVVIMDMPNAFSKMLGEDTKKLERLISRGACISWSPKNLASSLIMYSIKWMVKNTEYRLFTAYSDPEANEIGTIYQACNFYYLGANFGAGYKYRIRENKWVSDRYFRSRSVYKKLALENNIEWKAEYQTGDKVNFDLMPSNVSKQIKDLSKELQNSCEKIKNLSKGKYAYILGVNKTETKKLKNYFLNNNKTVKYPKR